MIVCPVCRHSNDEFSITCSSCSSYIQDRVPNLDFFSVIWLLVESPTIAFKKIIIAEHKNFVLLLSLFLGIAVVFGMMWGKRSGNMFDNLFPLLLYGIAIGLLAGIPLFYLFSGIMHGLAKVLRGSAPYIVSYGIVGWSLVPVMLSVVFVLPLELSTLGLVFFSSNPSAIEVKPVVTMVLVGLDGAFVLWSMILAATGMSAAHRFKIWKGITVTVISTAVVGYISVFMYSFFFI
jgi:hypothetical protein